MLAFQSIQETHKLQSASFSFGRRPPAVVIGRIAVHRMEMERGIAAEPLRCVFNDKMRTLNSVVGGDVTAGRNGGWTAPGKPGFFDIGFELGHADRGRAVVSN